MDWTAVPPFVSAVSGLLAVGVGSIAAVIGLKNLRHQRTTSDVTLALAIFRDINRYWDRLQDNPDCNYDYEMGQVLAHFEIAATLFNRKALNKAALPILKDHVVEVFTLLKTTPRGEELIGKCCSSPSTFSELQSFLRAHLPTALNALVFRENGSDSTGDNAGGRIVAS